MICLKLSIWLLVFFKVSIAVKQEDHFSSISVQGFTNPIQETSSKKRPRSESEEEKLDLDKIKPKRKYGKPPGSQSNDSKLNRKIVALLAEKDNGITNHDSARKAALVYLDEVREDNRVRQQVYRKIKREKRIQVKGKPYRPGYQSRDAVIARRMKTISKKDETLSQDEVRKLAEEKYRAAADKKNASTVKWQRRKRLKQQEQAAQNSRSP